jgi:hypothetical protein
LASRGFQLLMGLTEIGDPENMGKLALAPVDIKDVSDIFILFFMN